MNPVSGIFSNAVTPSIALPPHLDPTYYTWLVQEDLTFEEKREQVQEGLSQITDLTFNALLGYWYVNCPLEEGRNEFWELLSASMTVRQLSSFIRFINENHAYDFYLCLCPPEDDAAIQWLIALSDDNDAVKTLYDRAVFSTGELDRFTVAQVLDSLDTWDEEFQSLIISNIHPFFVFLAFAQETEKFNAFMKLHPDFFTDAQRHIVSLSIVADLATHETQQDSISLFLYEEENRVCEEVLFETIAEIGRRFPEEARAVAKEHLQALEEAVGIEDDEEFLREYPLLNRPTYFSLLVPEDEDLARNGSRALYNLRARAQAIQEPFIEEEQDSDDEEPPQWFLSLLKPVWLEFYPQLQYVKRSDVERICPSGFRDANIDWSLLDLTQAPEAVVAADSYLIHRGEAILTGFLLELDHEKGERILESLCALFTRSDEIRAECLRVRSEHPLLLILADLDEREEDVEEDDLDAPPTPSLQRSSPVSLEMNFGEDDSSVEGELAALFEESDDSDNFPVHTSVPERVPGPVSASLLGTEDNSLIGRLCRKRLFPS